MRILIKSETYLICSTLRNILEAEADIRVIGYDTSDDLLMDKLERTDLLLIYPPRYLDAANASITKVMTFVKQVKQEYSNVAIVLAGLPDAIPVIMSYLEAGADGYVLNKESVGALLKKLRAVENGRPIIDPAVTAALLDRITEMAHGNGLALISNPHQALAKLTNREREVLAQLGNGLINREIAQRLYIEVGTVKNHVHNILKKLNVSSRYEATAFAPLLAIDKEPESKRLSVNGRQPVAA